jgi:hypothetical protein
VLTCAGLPAEKRRLREGAEEAWVARLETFAMFPLAEDVAFPFDTFFMDR